MTFLVGSMKPQQECMGGIPEWLMLDCCALQVACRRYILQHKYETSYSTLAKRASKSNNFWNRLVRRGSKTRRVVMYGEPFCYAGFRIARLGFPPPEKIKYSPHSYFQEKRSDLGKLSQVDGGDALVFVGSAGWLLHIVPLTHAMLICNSNLKWSAAPTEVAPASLFILLCGSAACFLLRLHFSILASPPR